MTPETIEGVARMAGNRRRAGDVELIMRRFAWFVSLSLVVVAGCSSSARVSTPGSTSTTSTSVPLPSTPALRGTRVDSLRCPAPPISSAVSSIPTDTVQTLLLCPLGAPNASAGPITVGRDQPTFAALLTALSAADEPPTPGAVCPLYADLIQVVLAQASDGVYRLSIPTDGCKHYLRAALDALNRARGT